jgi:hypothetical protein
MNHNDYVDYLKDQADAAEADYHAQAEAEQRDRDEIARLNAKVDELESALAVAREDSKRLSELEKLAGSDKAGGLLIHHQIGGHVKWNGAGLGLSHRTLRRAIDAARKGKP